LPTTDDMLSELLARNADLFATIEAREAAEIMLIAGTIDDPDSFDEDGGKTGALGYYPIVNVNGQTLYFPCQARLKAIALGGANAEVLEGLVDQVAGKVAAVDTAVADAGAATALAIDKAALADAKATLAGQNAAAAQVVVDAGATLLAARDQAIVARDQAAANAGLLVNNSNPNLWIDPDIEALGGDGTYAWGAASFATVIENGARRAVLPAAAGEYQAGAGQDIAITSLPNNRLAASVLMSSKPAGAIGDFVLRLYPINAAGALITAPGVFDAPDALGNVNDEAGTSRWSRKLPAEAITKPRTVVICAGLDVTAAIAAGAVKVRPAWRKLTTAQATFSAFTMRNGTDPYYQPTRASAKTLADNVAAVAASGVSIGALATSLASSANPNLVADPEFEGVAVGSTVAWTLASGTAVNLIVVLANGAKRLQSPANATATSYRDSAANRIPVGKFPNNRVSASVIISNKAATNAGDLRVRLIAYDDSGVVVSGWSLSGNDDGAAGFYGRWVPTAASSTPYELVVAQGVPTPAGAASIGFELRVATTVPMLWSFATLRNGDNPHYVPAPVSAKAVNDLAGAIGTAAARPQARIDYGWSDNLCADPMLARAGLTVGAPDWTATLDVVTKRRLRTVKIPAQGATAASRRFLTFVDLSNVADGDPVSVSVVLAEKLGLTDISTRVRLYAFNSSGAAVAIGGTVLPGNDVSSDATAYSRAIPAGNIAKPTTIVIWEGLPKPAGVTRLAFDVRMQNNPDMFFTGFNVREGGDVALSGGTAVASVSGGVVYLAPTGLDTNAGTIGSPLLTVQAAITMLGGSGTVRYAAGDYPAQRFDPATVTGKVRLVGTRAAAPNYDRYPRIYLASKLTGITKTAGQAKVYQAAVAGLPTLANFNWAYQDGVADPRTLIASGDRSPQHRGRRYRLSDTCKLVKTTATTLAAALTEIDATGANDPRAFIDSGILYFSIVGGGDGTTADIYVDAATGFVAAGAREAFGEIEIQGLELRYGGLPLTSFRRAHLEEVVVIGARTNAVDYSVLTFSSLETACAGSAAGAVGDGINGHNGSKLPRGDDAYSHDNQDDGASDHEGCGSRFNGGLFEFNGGAGIAPAYGADQVADGAISRSNCTIAGRKPAGFAVVGGPSGSSLADAGLDTNALWINCVSIRDPIGFYDTHLSGDNLAVAIGCKAIDSLTYGYSMAEIRDCGWSSATGTAKSAGTVAKNTALVA
jgi:hypothetical protein